MSAERITVDAVEAAIVEFDAQERPVVAGQVVMSLGMTGMVIAALAPREWEEVAAHLGALVERAPLKEGRSYVAHRAIYGALASELRQYARLAGEPVGLEADLRGATSKAEERRIRERLADQHAARDRELDDVEHQSGIAHDQVVEDTDRIDALMSRDPYLSGVVIGATDLTERGLIEPDDSSEETATAMPTAAAPDPTDDELAAWQ